MHDMIIILLFFLHSFLVSCGIRQIFLNTVHLFKLRLGATLSYVQSIYKRMFVEKKQLVNADKHVTQFALSVFKWRWPSN